MRKVPCSCFSLRYVWLIFVRSYFVPLLPFLAVSGSVRGPAPAFSMWSIIFKESRVFLAVRPPDCSESMLYVIFPIPIVKDIIGQVDYPLFVFFTLLKTGQGVLVNVFSSLPGCPFSVFLSFFPKALVNYFIMQLQYTKPMIFINFKITFVSISICKFNFPQSL